MATVYLARDEQHFRQVALKAFRLESDAGDGADRFLQEIKVVARLAHPNILPLHDSGQIDGFLYYVMPYVPGESLRQRLEREGALPIADALAIAGQVASALAYAHSHDVIHRDIKPDNILFLAGQAVVADFGIARAISAGGWKRKDLLEERVGTPAYMSPEQASGGSRAVDHRSDLYSLGCVLYEMLTGEPPFRGTTPEDLVVQHLEAEPAPVETRRATVPPELRRLVGRALSKNPADRYATAHQFAEAIARVQQGEAAAATPAEPLPVRRAAIPWRWLLPAAAIAAVVYAAFVTAATRRGLGAGATDPGHLAVAPFVHHEGAAPLLLTGEQCARLLREALTRWDDVSVVDSRWFDDRIARLPAPAELDELLRLAREARAGRLLSGEVWPFRDSVRIRGVLYETGRGARVLRERTVTVSASLEDLEARFTELADSLLLPRAQAPPPPVGARHPAHCRVAGLRLRPRRARALGPAGGDLRVHRSPGPRSRLRPGPPLAGADPELDGAPPRQLARPGPRRPRRPAAAPRPRPRVGPRPRRPRRAALSRGLRALRGHDPPRLARLPGLVRTGGVPRPRPHRRGRSAEPLRLALPLQLPGGDQRLSPRDAPRALGAPGLPGRRIRPPDARLLRRDQHLPARLPRRSRRVRVRGLPGAVGRHPGLRALAAGPDRQRRHGGPWRRRGRRHRPQPPSPHPAHRRVGPRLPRQRPRARGQRARPRALGGVRRHRRGR
ncbi:MAG: serine/threonine protein kinase [Gemmatimonadetes bacterium]|nr:serine/threonine protein kinase [Gemmatimonadota bacterium]